MTRGVKLDLTGQRFSRLQVVEWVKPTKKWRCKCDCGCVKEIRADSLIQGTVRSCGCLRREMLREPGRVVSHGHTTYKRKSATYRSWSNMIHRCLRQGGTPLNPKALSFPPAWRAFENFLTDMGACPAGHCLRRRDADDDFSRENCVWVPYWGKARTANPVEG